MTKQQTPTTEQDSDFDDVASAEAKDPIENAVEPEQQQNEDVTSQAKETLDYPVWVENFQTWLGTGRNNEAKNLVEFFDRSSKWWAAAKELTADEFNQKSTLLKRDLMMFYHHYQADMAESEFVQAIKESAWHELADMTDKAQIEWQELKQDFNHQGTYEQGEWVGMGIIECRDCHYKMTFVHPQRLPACPQCGHGSFLREALAP